MANGEQLSYAFYTSEYVEDLIKDFLYFRGYSATLKALESDQKNTRDKMLQPARILKEIQTQIDNHDLSSLRDYWGYLHKQFFSRLERDHMEAIRRIETGILRLYLASAIKEGKKEKVNEFFEMLAPELQHIPEWKDWFAIPYIKGIQEHPKFGRYFSKVYFEKVMVSLHNFISTILAYMPRPMLLRFEDELIRSKSLIRENDNLVQQLSQANVERRCVDEELHKLKNRIRDKDKQLKLLKQQLTDLVSVSGTVQRPRSDSDVPVMDRTELRSEVIRPYSITADPSESTKSLDPSFLLKQVSPATVSQAVAGVSSEDGENPLHSETNEVLNGQTKSQVKETHPTSKLLENTALGISNFPEDNSSTHTEDSSVTDKNIVVFNNYDKLNESPFLFLSQDRYTKESTPAKHAPSDTTHSKCEMMEFSLSNEFDIEPDFNLDYDEDDLPPLPTIEDEPMDCTQEDSSRGSLRMEIKNIYFGSLSCKPLDKLEITPELFKLHIQFTHEDTIFKRLLNINRENIKDIELNTLISSGFIIITPKSQFYNQLSIDLQLIPTIYLNQGDSQYFKTIIIINFNNKAYSINSIFCKLEEWYGEYISVRIDEKNNYKLLGHDGKYSNSTSLEDNGISSKRTKRDSLIISSLNSPTVVSQSITVSSDSPTQEESSVLPEIDHSYTSKGGRSHAEPVIEEFYQLIESEEAKLLTFPEAGHPGRITIPKDTIKCLQPEIFLNDTIIEFYLHYIQHQLQPKQKEQVHMFNTFFYTKLTNNLDIHLTTENTKAQHSLVSKWTKNVNLFSKDFILVPIHDHAHWFLAIICYPCLAGKDPIILDEDIAVLDSTETSKQFQRKRRPRIEKKACILIFDSLNIQRNTVSTNLRLYLQAEWNARHPSDTSYKCSEGQLLVGHHPKLPVQPNSWDCGLFLMQYAESFLSTPPDDFNFPLKLEKMFSLEEIKHKRNQIIKLIFDLSHDERYSIKRV